MSEINRMYCGFYLASLSAKQNNKYVVQVACFQPKTNFRKKLLLTVEKQCDYAYGEMIHFYTQDDELKQNSLIVIKEDVNPFFLHATNFTDSIVYTMQNFYVSTHDLPDIHVYNHFELGEMRDPHSAIEPGGMSSASFKVVLDDNDSFYYEIAGGQTGADAERKEARLLTEKFDNIHEIIRIEHQYNIQTENEAWKEIGVLSLVDYDQTRFDGWRPILKISSDEHLELFMKQRQNAEVVMIKQEIVSESPLTYADDPNFEPQFATLMEDAKFIVAETKVIAQLKDPYRHKFERLFNPGDVFRFESALVDKTGKFWENQKQHKNELYQETVVMSTPADINELKMQDLLDSFARPTGCPEEKDRGTSKFDLNDKQYEAVKMALNEHRKVVCIQGPPGTGKTHVLSTLLASLVFKRKQAIVMTPTREALKNIRDMTEAALKKKNIPYNDNTLMDNIKFDEAINSSPRAQQALAEIIEWTKDAQGGKLPVETLDEWREHRIKKTIHEEGKEIMAGVRVVFATMQSSFAQKAMRVDTFLPVMCVIDEAAQVMETQTWPAVTKMKRIVMAGDPRQLPALVKTAEGQAAKLQESIMDRIIHNKEKFSWIMLTEQYRCHPEISRWSSNSFYHAQLINNVAEQETIHPKFTTKPPRDFARMFDPMVLVDTSMEFNCEEKVKLFERRPLNKEDEKKDNKKEKIEDSDRPSFENKGEAMLVIIHYKHLRQLGIPAENIAIITPYKGQVELLKCGMSWYEEKSNDSSCVRTTIGTVDSVQGQEYDCLIFSMVRSNPRKTMGFVSDLRRLNVVITRAKRHFMFIGNGYLMASAHQPEIRDLFNSFYTTRHRFHPQNVFYNSTSPSIRVINNFGPNFQHFVEYSNDKEMKQWCAKYVERQNDPMHRMKMHQRKEERKARFNRNYKYNAQLSNRTDKQPTSSSNGVQNGSNGVQNGSNGVQNGTNGVQNGTNGVQNGSNGVEQKASSEQNGEASAEQKTDAGQEYEYGPDTDSEQDDQFNKDSEQSDADDVEQKIDDDSQEDVTEKAELKSGDSGEVAHNDATKDQKADGDAGENASIALEIEAMSIDDRNAKADSEQKPNGNENATDIV